MPLTILGPGFLVLSTFLALGGCSGPLAVPDFVWTRIDLNEVSLPKLGQALGWAQPIEVGGVIIRIPAPADHQELCENDAVLRKSLQQAMGSLRLLACYRQGDEGPIATLSTLAHDRAVDSVEFVRYKQSLAARASLIQKAATSYTGDSPLSQVQTGRAEVLKVLRNSKNWVVHAVVRAGSHGPEQGVSASVWVHERLLYLTQFDTRKPDWSALTDFAQTWATSTIARTLWSRAH